MASEIPQKWLSMKQVVAITGLRATTISRYKDEFTSFIESRLNGQILEFTEEAVDRLRWLYMTYNDRTEGRRTTTKVRELIAEKYGYLPEIIDVHLPAQDDKQDSLPALREQMGVIFSYLEKRLDKIEGQNDQLINLQQEIAATSSATNQAVREQMDVLTEVVGSRMAKRKGFWARLFGR